MTQRHPIQNEHVMLITTVTKNRHPYFLNHTFARAAVESMYQTQNLHPFFLFAFVVMPDHVHLLLRVPAPENISIVVKSYKLSVTGTICIGPLWQRRFHVRIAHHPPGARRYIHKNPLSAGLSNDITSYPWSSGCGKWDVTDLPMF